LKYLHTMIRVLDLEKALAFFSLLGLEETRRKEISQGRFTLVFLATHEGEPEVELTYNWDQEEAYSIGRNFGHLAYRVKNIYDICRKLQDGGITILRPPLPRTGRYNECTPCIGQRSECKNICIFRQLKKLWGPGEFNG